jgi:hypothetical protein
VPKKVDRKDALKKVRKAAAEGKVTFPSQELIRKLKPHMDRIMRVLGHPEAFITDESMVSDFFGSNDLAPDEMLEMMEQELGVPVSHEDYLWMIATRMDMRAGGGA